MKIPAKVTQTIQGYTGRAYIRSIGVTITTDLQHDRDMAVSTLCSATNAITRGRATTLHMTDGKSVSVKKGR